jgi:hypothetical protein
MTWLKAKLLHWLIGDRLAVQEQFARDTIVVVKTLLEMQKLEVREELEPDPEFVLPKPPHIRVLRLYKQK